jgi:hypothetical protein
MAELESPVCSDVPEEEAPLDHLELLRRELKALAGLLV